MLHAGLLGSARDDEPCNSQVWPTSDSVRHIASAIWAELVAVRRSVQASVTCDGIQCKRCAAQHIRRIESAIEADTPVTFVLPAFPGKSPNPKKVLGHLPDRAEALGLQALRDLCARIARIHAPGAHIVICSDGRVFSDVVGMPEQHVTSYQHALAAMIDEIGGGSLSVFNLDMLVEGCSSFDGARQALMRDYGRSLDVLRAQVRKGADGTGDREDADMHRLYCGITRFLFEDALHPGHTKSRSTLQKHARMRAYQVILRSNAWSELIAARFPDAVRLSIHPQACGSLKAGIQLVGDNSWMTPWHGVAVDTGDGFVLMKRWEAEELGSELVLDAAGRASHFRLPAPRIDAESVPL